ncbi:MAG: hypothetical protein ACLQVX_01895 [Limisphaerales bacterium]
MKRNILIGTLILTAGTLLAADPKDEVTAAAKALAGKDNYSWKQTTENAGGGGFGGGTSEGKAEKGGFTWVSMEGRNNSTIEAVRKGEKTAVKTQDGWQSVAELTADQGGGRGRFMAMRFRNFKAPAEQVQDVVAKAKELKKDGDAFSGDLTEDGAKAQLMFGGRGGGNGPEISGAKASVKVWLKDGLLAKYELKVKGTVSFNGNDRDVDRTTTVEIKDIGSTKLQVPDDAKKKLE